MASVIVTSEENIKVFKKKQQKTVETEPRAVKRDCAN